MSVIYRPHRGTLAESMSEARVFDNLKDMIEYIVKSANEHFKRYGGKTILTTSDIVLMDVTDDDRIGWQDCMYVCSWQGFEGKSDYPQCIGMCTTNYARTLEKAFSDMRGYAGHGIDNTITMNFRDTNTCGILKIGDEEYKVYLGKVTEQNTYDSYLSEYGYRIKTRQGMKEFTLIQYDGDYEEFKTRIKG